IRKHHDGRWEARYTAMVDGAWKRRSIMAKTRQEAATRLRKALSARDPGAVPVSAKETVGNFLEAWLKGAESGLRPRTFASYRQMVRDHLATNLGRLPLARLQPQHVQALREQLLGVGRSAKTVRNVHLVLHRALEKAVRWRLITVNVADLVDPPRVKRREM